MQINFEVLTSLSQYRSHQTNGYFK